MLILAYQILRMNEQTMEIKMLTYQDVPTVPYNEIMNEQFIQAYHDALKFSNLSLDNELKYRNIGIYENEHMHELYTTSMVKKPHLVLLHGYGGTSLTFVRTFQHLKDHFQVHALDTFGVGLSSRGRWNQKMTFEQAGHYYVDAIQQWRKTVGIQSFILAGHSFGGYISALYYQKYANRVKHLIFLSPAGSGKLSDETIEARAQKSKLFFCVAQKIFNCGIRPSKVMNNFFVGNKFIERILNSRLKLQDEEKSAWKKYLKQISNINETSEGGFYKFFQWPLQPVRSIEEILKGINQRIKIDIFFGDNDWMSAEGAVRLTKEFKNIELHIIQNAGHQMIFDNPISVTQKIKQCIEK